MTANSAPPPAPPKVSLATFIGKLRDSGLLPDEDIAAARAELPAHAHAEDCAGRLVRSGRLTAYQANELLHGRANGFVLGNYIIQKSLGEGGMGKVFLARHRRMKREVALKVLPPARAREPHAARRFAREVEAISRLHHPNIAAAFDADEVRGVQFLALEYVPGHDLARELKARGALPIAEAAACVAQAARGLAYAHRQGVIHRDVKPHNLMRGPDGVVKILDMGLARLAEGAAAEPRNADDAAPTATELGATLSGRVVGTPDYIAPEQAAGEPLDFRCDLYSLGCTLFHLCAGRPPFPHAALHEKLLAHALDPVPSLADAAPHAPPALVDLCARLMAKRPADRPSDADAVADELERLADAGGPSFPGRPPSGLSARPGSEIDDFARLMQAERLQQVAPAPGNSTAGISGQWRRANAWRRMAGIAAGIALAGVLALSALPRSAPAPATREKPAGPTARARLDAALRELAEANPRFGSRLDPQAPLPCDAEFNAAGELLKLRLPSDAVTDLAALAGLPPLPRLEIVPRDGAKGRLERLAPLAVPGLRSLSLTGNPQLRDLGPLAGLKLEELDLAGTRVVDLAPLVGMPLRKLSLERTSVFDLAPLAAMRTLREVRIGGIPATGLEPLAGLPIEELAADAADEKVAALVRALPKLRKLNGGPVPGR